MALQRPVKTWALLGLLLLLYHHHHGLAASGGRMGGSSFSFRSSRTQIKILSKQVLSNFRSYSASDEGEASRILFVFFIIVVYVVLNAQRTSVLKLQVGLLGTARSLKRDLNRIAMTADTSGPDGFKYVLHEATSALLRHPEYCISGYSSVDVRWVVEESEQLFNQLSIEERGKFDEETLVNVHNIIKQSSTSHGSNGVHNEYIAVRAFNMTPIHMALFDEETLVDVNNLRKKSATSEKSKVLSNECIVVTIIVAARGIHKLPPIESSAQLKEVLQKLASIPSRNIMAAEVLWTPQEENDILTKQEVLKDYPLLHSF